MAHPHPLLNFGPTLWQAASELSEPKQWRDKVVVLNLLYDYRPSPVCDGALCRLASPKAKLEDIVKAYLALSRSDPGKFLFGADNENNVVFRRDPARPKGSHLGDRTLVNLMKVRPLLLGLPTDPGVERSLEQLLLGGKVTERSLDTWFENPPVPLETVKRVVLDLYNRYRAKRHVWVADAEQFDRVALPHQPDTWLPAVGLPLPAPHPDSPHRRDLLLQFRYPAKAVPALARPTQLESGWFAYHFPSPPSAPAEAGGFSLNLGPFHGTRTLVSEYVHEQIDLDPDWLQHAQFLGTESSPESKLRQLRISHHELLGRHYSLDGWMKNPNEIPDV